MSILSDITSGKWATGWVQRNKGFLKDVGGFISNPMGSHGGKSFLMQKLEGGKWGKTFGLNPHDDGEGPFGWDFHKDWAGGAWQDRTGVRRGDGVDWEDFKEGWSGANLVDKRLGLEGNQFSYDQFNKSWGAGAWEDRLGSNIYGRSDGGGGSDEIDESYTDITDDDGEDDNSNVNEALTESEPPPSGMGSRAYGWSANIRRALGGVGEDLYKTRGKKASILTRRGMLG